MNLLDLEEKVAKNTHVVEALKHEMEEFRLKFAKVQDEVAWLKEHVMVKAPDD